MTTLGILKARIADEMARPDLTSQIATAITDAIEFYADRRFIFNQGSDPQSTVAGTENYDLPSDFRKADKVTIIQGNTRFDLTQITFQRYLEYATLPATPSGTPAKYALWNEDIYLYSTPAAIDTLTIWYLKDLSAFANDSASNGWTTTAELLIRAHAKAELWANVVRDFKEAAVQDAKAVKYLANLTRKTGRALGRGFVRPSTF